MGTGAYLSFGVWNLPKVQTPTLADEKIDLLGDWKGLSR